MNGRVTVVRMAAVFGTFVILFTWIFATAPLRHGYLDESDLYEYFLPMFLAPLTTWSPYEFSGLPAFADIGDAKFYPLHAIAASVLHSWTMLVVSAYVLAGTFTCVYVRRLTGSWFAGLFAGLAFALSEAMMERTPHLGILHAWAWLPLVALSLEHVRDGASTAWIAIGGFALANVLLAGHPQPALYIISCTALYAVVLGRADRGGRAYYLRASAMFGIGGLLAAARVLPFLESTFYITRQDVSLGQFTARSNTLPQLLSLLFPAVLHDGREAPTYVGVATLIFASVGALRVRSEWRARFWLAAAIVALVIGMGDATPIPRLLHALPVVGRFRVIARLLVITAFGLSVLSGVGVATILRAAASRTAIRSILIAVAAACVLGAIGIGSWPSLFALEQRNPLPWSALSRLGIWDEQTWLQLILAAASVAACAALVRRPGSRVYRVAMVAVLVADALHAQPNRITARGLDVAVLPAEDIRPSVHAERLREELEPLHQRLLTPGGSQKDSVSPATFSRLWRIANAGGYGPMLLSRYSDLASMGTNGSVAPAALRSENSALDVMAVRYVLLTADDLPSRGTITLHGLDWEREPLGLSIGRPDCDQRYTRSISLPVDSAVLTSSIAFGAYLRCSEDVPQGAEVARVRVVASDGTQSEHSLRAGVDIAEAALTDPALRARARHTMTAAFDESVRSGLLDYFVRIDLPQRSQVDRVEISTPVTGGWMNIDHLTLVDSAGHSHPQRRRELLFDDRTRWKEVAEFATSRVTDRPDDQSEAGEQRYTVLENLRARPRAWFVSEVVSLNDRDALESIHHSQLPDGRPFNAARLAITSPGGGEIAATTTGASDARLLTIADGRVSIDATSESGGFVVLSDSWYPGWQARIDGRPAALRRTNVSMMGVAVPAGRHRVDFLLSSATQRAGIAISAITAMAVLLLLALHIRGGHA